jgi:hypothetical protein
VRLFLLQYFFSFLKPSPREPHRVKGEERHGRGLGLRRFGLLSSELGIARYALRVSLKTHCR